VTYKEDPLPNMDEFLFCDTCDEEYLGGCPKHKIALIDGR
jgi:hypothetical protein